MRARSRCCSRRVKFHPSCRGQKLECKTRRRFCGIQSQRAEPRERRCLPQIVVEALVKPGRATQHATRFSEQEILRLWLKAHGEIADKFGEGRGAIVEQRTRRRVGCFRGLKHSGK